MKTFKINTTYKTNFITNHDAWIFFKVTKRTAKTVTIKDVRTGEIKNCRVNTYENVEEIYPLGKYSMAPILKANRTA